MSEKNILTLSDEEYRLIWKYRAASERIQSVMMGLTEDDVVVVNEYRKASMELKSLLKAVFVFGNDMERKYN